jgi:chemotaxis signal transduction protein
MIPIVDLREKLGLEITEATLATRVMIEVESSAVGIVADSTSQIERLPNVQFEQPPAVLGKISEEYMTSVGMPEKGLIMLLDAERIAATSPSGTTGRLESVGMGKSI